MRDIFLSGRAATLSGDASPLRLAAVEVREAGRPEYGWKFQYLKRELCADNGRGSKRMYERGHRTDLEQFHKTGNVTSLDVAEA